MTHKDTPKALSPCHHLVPLIHKENVYNSPSVQKSWLEFIYNDFDIENILLLLHKESTSFWCPIFLARLCSEPPLVGCPKIPRIVRYTHKSNFLPCNFIVKIWKCLLINMQGLFDHARLKRKISYALDIWCSRCEFIDMIGVRLVVARRKLFVWLSVKYKSVLHWRGLSVKDIWKDCRNLNTKGIR